MPTRRKEPTPEELTDKTCDWPGCKEPAPYRAPRSRTELRSYYHFCMEHVRVYNATWNYYAGMSDAEVEADRRRDTTWDRPTWAFGSAPRDGARKRPAAEGFYDPFGFMNDDPEGEKEETYRKRTGPVSGFDADIFDALSVLDLKPPISEADLKKRYKDLVKRYHPDVTGGDKDAEERFKQISVAYETIRETLATLELRPHMDKGGERKSGR
ncbi:MAG: J domain-containing protein [Magnetovibrionaceae bacterium]